VSRGVRTLAHYARWIEGRWSALLEAPVVLSPADWELIRDWHARRVPLVLIGECIDAVAERIGKGRARRRPRGLSHVERAVEEAWQAWSANRDPTCPAAPHGAREGTAQAPSERLRAYLTRTPPTAPVRELLDRLVAADEAGLALDELERMLDDELPGCVPRDLLAAVERELDLDLAGYRGRLPSDQLERVRRRARARRLRQRLGLPGLAAPR
jgi:hypothetical protein